MENKKPYPKDEQPEKKIETVMHEFKGGKLRSSSGDKVTKKSQALAIALSEGRRKGAEQRTSHGRERLRPPLKKKSKLVEALESRGESDSRY